MNGSNQMKEKEKSPRSTSPLIYIIVIGFHHKKGCQVEFVYPCDNRILKLTESDSDLYRLPKNWKHLPSLALPDGSHNYDSDYIYFHLEDQPENEELLLLQKSEAGQQIVDFSLIIDHIGAAFSDHRPLKVNFLGNFSRSGLNQQIHEAVFEISG